MVGMHGQRLSQSCLDGVCYLSETSTLTIEVEIAGAREPRNHYQIQKFSNIDRDRSHSFSHEFIF
jgi:hypothetical protein